ncbi:MAG: ABC transporter permease [Candidatus Heimdallarchaeota archaeon]|nr:ABC transporter permease [Candidatus Heimdallarchaeota archaeon]MDH5646779.1 ABC transporter permease [Candidatus Heimdallarchaeota archaeon]
MMRHSTHKKIIIANVRTFKGVISKRWSIQKKYPLSLLFWFIFPILFMLPVIIFGSVLVGDRYSDNLMKIAGYSDIWTYSGLGLIYFNFLLSITWHTSYAIRDEEFLGTLESYYVTPSSKIAYTMANGLYAILLNGFTVSIQLLFLFSISPNLFRSGIIFALIYILVGIIFIQGITFIFSAAVLTFKNGWRIVFTFEVLLGLFTPIAYPIAILPTNLQKISIYSPFTIGVDGFRNSLIFGPNSINIGDIFILLTWGVCVLILGTKVYSKQEKRIRKKGTLGQY